MFDIFKIITESVENNRIEFLFYTIAVIILIWLYKESKNFIVQNKKSESERIDKALEVYSELQVNINNYISNSIERKELEISFAKVYPFIPKYILNQIWVWMDDDYNGNGILREILKNLKNEILNLKQKQHDIVSYGLGVNTSAFDIFEYKIKTSNLDLFVLPMVFAGLLFGIFYGIFLLAITIASNMSNYAAIITIIFRMFASIMFLLIFIICCELIISRNSNYSIKKWLLTVIILSVNLILFFINNWIISIINFLIMFIFPIILIKGFKIKMPLNKN